MNTFYNPEFGANDVVRLNFSYDMFLTIKSSLENYGLNKLWKVKPKWNSDIEWLSPNTLNQYKLFNDIFNALNVSKIIKDALKLDFNITLYCGFIVKRSWCEDVNFHTDWNETRLKAFTLITPLIDEGDDFGLNYIKNDLSLGEYYYKPGEAIVFAEGFCHSSMPTKNKREVFLLSFTFGTDDMSYWPQLSKSVQTQSNLIRLPNGDFRVRNLGHFINNK
jgi:hypothetical protein